MNTSDDWIKDELLLLFYSLVDDFKTGVISDAVFKERLLKLAERYERTFVRKEPGIGQKDLF